MVSAQFLVLSLFSYDRLSKKPLLFKSFTGLTLKEFDDIYDEITKRYVKHEVHRLSKRKNRERGIIGAGRHFKLDIKKPVSHAFDILSSVHNLHISWLSV